MARKHILIFSALLISSCSSGPKVDSRFDPSYSAGPNEGVISGTYPRPVGIARAVALSALKRAILTFREEQLGTEIEIQTATDGKFSFRAPQGKYRLVKISADPLEDVLEAPKDGITFEITAGQSKSIGTLYSSCEPWNETDETHRIFQNAVTTNFGKNFKKYIGDQASCLVLQNP